MDDRFLSDVAKTNYTWRNRRRMAWLAFAAIVVVTGLCFFWVDIERLEKLETVITWFYMAMASIVGAYMGFATYASVNGGNRYSGYDYGRSVEEGSGVTPDDPDAEPRRRRADRRPVGVE